MHNFTVVLQWAVVSPVDISVFPYSMLCLLFVKLILKNFTAAVHILELLQLTVITKTVPILEEKQQSAHRHNP